MAVLIMIIVMIATPFVPGPIMTFTVTLLTVCMCTIITSGEEHGRRKDWLLRNEVAAAIGALDVIDIAQPTQGQKLEQLQSKALDSAVREMQREFEDESKSPKARRGSLVLVD
jgi:hypothetical protein